METTDIFHELQDLLCSLDPDYMSFRLRILQLLPTQRGLDTVRCGMVLRLILALEDFCEKQAGPVDILVLIRQIIRSYACRLTLHRILWDKISQFAYACSVHLATELEDDLCEIIADPWQPHWLTATEQIDHLALRRNDPPAIGDGLIAALTDGAFTTYQSVAQKIAVQECLFAPPGSTLLITLPTGAGKSLCVQLPAWWESAGGSIKGGTTLVVVPTVSLALDQEERARKLFPLAYGQDFTPSSLTGATPNATRAAIYKGIEQGTLPLLFTSPESLMTPALYQVCLEAAKRDTIRRLVIDEVHLVETWGAGFRTEFQFLAAYRKKLLEASHGHLRTILLSATVKDDSEALFRRLFGSRETFYTVRADRLRPEIGYWFNHVKEPAERETHVLEALKHLPRPTILYVTSPDDTKNWLRLLKQQGFQRIAAFSGETKSEDRLHHIKAWNENRYDIMIATSAFGVGVDKSDVRTVIHACLPENIDRFYQEVGRTGRDGYSAISLMCLSDKDYDEAKGMNRTARITTPKATSRWEGMYQTRRPVPTYGDRILVDTNATPSGKEEMHKGPSNREWNEHTLLLMQRTGLITITDMREELPEEQQEDSSQEINEETNPTWLQIQLHQPHITDHPQNQDFFNLIEKVRQEEVNKIQLALQQIQDIVAKSTSKRSTHCLSRHFATIYQRSSSSCGGCPYCRKMQLRPFVGHLEVELEGKKASLPLPPPHSMELTALLGTGQRGNVLFNDPYTLNDLKTIQPVLVHLVRMGFQQLIIPYDLVQDAQWSEALVRDLSSCIEEPHIILPTSWVCSDEDRPVYAIPTVVIYPLNNEEADIFHQALHHRIASLLNQVPLLVFARRNLFLHSEHGTFVDRINGMSHSLERLQDHFRNPNELIF